MNRFTPFKSCPLVQPMTTLYLALTNQRPKFRGHGVMILTIVVAACSAVPSKFIKQAEPGVTLSDVTGSPQQYRDKIVILGGVVVQEQETSGQIWLPLRNRPLDPQFHPHRPISLDGPEAGHFWVTAAHRQELPPQYRQWARMTVVGRFIGTANEEPVLLLMYARGWDVYGKNEDTWETTSDPAYVPVIPEGLHGEFQAQ